MGDKVIGSVSELWRYPVKSMQGEQVTASEVTRRGLSGDRAYALVDVESARLVSAKRPRRWGRVLQLSAALLDPSTSPPGVVISRPDGTSFPAGPEAAEPLSRWLGRQVTLVAAAPQGAVMEEIWSPDKGESLYGPVLESEDDQPVIGVTPSLGAPAGGLFDFSAVHLLTSGSLQSLAGRVAPGGADVRRFRPNVVIDTAGGAGTGEGFPENAWVGRSIRLGESVTVEGIMLTMRCVMITLEQPGLAADWGVMRATADANRVEVPGVGTYPCLGLYARVTGHGTVRAGDEVVLLED